MKEPLVAQRSPTRIEGYARGVKNIDEAITDVGSAADYQQSLLLLFVLQFLFSAFIEMGFPIIFRPAMLVCPDGSTCTEEVGCSQPGYTVSNVIKSVAYTFDLVCKDKRLLQICFDAFLYGGLFGSLYYGEIIERKGRRYVVSESMAIMLVGIVVSLVGGNVTVFSIGVFLINFGFRGYYNAAVLTLTEVTSDNNRLSTPIILHIGWAAGQISVALLGLFFNDWRVIFVLTGIPLIILTVMAYRNVLESPRFLVVRHDFFEARAVLDNISVVNQHPQKAYDLLEEKKYREQMETYVRMNNGAEVVAETRHHSYMSLFKYKSIRVRVLAIMYIWSIISLSYFTSANSLLNDKKSLSFNLALAGAIEIIAYLAAISMSLNAQRLVFIKNLLIYSGLIHLMFYFVRPIHEYGGFGRLVIMSADILIRVSMSMGNVFMLIYSLETFPTVVRHFALGLLGFVTKSMYVVSIRFINFWAWRDLHPDFIIGVLLLGGLATIGKLRETKTYAMRDYLEEDEYGTLMVETKTGLFTS